VNAPQNRFGLDGGPEAAPFPMFELMAVVFYVAMLAMLIAKLDIKSEPAKVAAAAFGAWVSVALLCGIGLFSTMGFTDGSEPLVFALASLVTLVLLVGAGIVAGISALKNKSTHNHG
jgi:peptidoglycan/LPS O-acetylase OafA/YrhL